MEAEPTQGPRKFSGISRSLTGSLIGKCKSESQKGKNVSEAQMAEKMEHLKAAAKRKVAQEAAAHRVNLRVDESFRDRIDFRGLSWIKPLSVVRYCEEFSRNWREMKPPLLAGPSGCGKTHLLWATASVIADWHNSEVMGAANMNAIFDTEVVEKGRTDYIRVEYPSMSLLVTDGSEIAHGIRSSVAKGNLDDVVRMFRQEGTVDAGGSAIMFIDDVEVAKMSDWLHEELYRIFNRRYARKIPTFITTNLTPTEMRAHLGDRITRRIMDMTEPFVLEQGA